MASLFDEQAPLSTLSAGHLGHVRRQGDTELFGVHAVLVIGYDSIKSYQRPGRSCLASLAKPPSLHLEDGIGLNPLTPTSWYENGDSGMKALGTK